MPALLLRLLTLCPRKQTLYLSMLIFRTTLKEVGCEHAENSSNQVKEEQKEQER